MFVVYLNLDVSFYKGKSNMTFLSALLRKALLYLGLSALSI